MKSTDCVWSPMGIEKEEGLEIYSWSMFSDHIREAAEGINEDVKKILAKNYLFDCMDEHTLDRIPFKGNMFTVVRKRFSRYRRNRMSPIADWVVKSNGGEYNSIILWSALFTSDSPLKPLAFELYRRGWLKVKRHNWNMSMEGNRNG